MSKISCQRVQYILKVIRKAQTTKAQTGDYPAEQEYLQIGQEISLVREHLKECQNCRQLSITKSTDSSKGVY